jgi:hypothetical protein
MIYIINSKKLVAIFCFLFCSSFIATTEVKACTLNNQIEYPNILSAGEGVNKAYLFNSKNIHTTSNVMPINLVTCSKDAAFVEIIIPSGNKIKIPLVVDENNVEIKRLKNPLLAPFQPGFKFSIILKGNNGSPLIESIEISESNYSQLKSQSAGNLVQD